MVLAIEWTSLHREGFWSHTIFGRVGRTATQTMVWVLRVQRGAPVEKGLNSRILTASPGDEDLRLVGRGRCHRNAASTSCPLSLSFSCCEWVLGHLPGRGSGGRIETAHVRLLRLVPESKRHKISEFLIPSLLFSSFHTRSAHPTQERGTSPSDEGSGVTMPRFLVRVLGKPPHLTTHAHLRGSSDDRNFTIKGSNACFLGHPANVCCFPSTHHHVSLQSSTRSGRQRCSH